MAIKYRLIAMNDLMRAGIYNNVWETAREDTEGRAGGVHRWHRYEKAEHRHLVRFSRNRQREPQAETAGHIRTALPHRLFQYQPSQHHHPLEELVLSPPRHRDRPRSRAGRKPNMRIESIGGDKAVLAQDEAVHPEAGSGNRQDSEGRGEVGWILWHCLSEDAGQPIPDNQECACEILNHQRLQRQG